MIEDPLTEQVIGCAFTVLNSLGPGFLEKVYENALAHECRKAGLLIENRLLVELKAVRALDSTHLAQTLNYLKATGHPACLLLNFGNPRLEIKRIINTNKPI